MKVVLRKIRTFFRFNSTQLLWLIPSYLLSGIFRATILTMPFRKIAPWLGSHYENATITTLTSPEQERRARDIGTVIHTVSKYTPWESKCLVETLIATLILRLYNIPHSAYLGVSKDESEDAENPLKAHAWVSSGRYFVTGGNGHRNFTVVSTFISDPEIVTHTVSKHAT